MGNLLKDTLQLLNKNLWLLFLFMTISYVGMIYVGILRASANTLPEILIGTVTLLFIIVASIAGFFHTLRTTVTDCDAESYELLKTFPKGVADYFFTALGIVFIYFALTLAAFLILVAVGKSFIGTFSFSPEDFTKAFASVEALSEFQKNISTDDLLKLSKWHLLYVTMTSILTYLMIYWLPEIFFNTKNPFLALFRAVKKTLLNPFQTFKLFVVIVLINIVISVLMALMLPIPLLLFLVYLVYFYGLLYILLIIFKFYQKKFVIKEIQPEPVEEYDEKSEEK